MTTRTIVTSQPDVACDVCERRLLRGEQPDVFLAAGRRRIVCELCAPRAAHEGWLRETDRQPVSLPPLRPRRGRSLFERLRQAGRPTDGEAGADSALAGDHERTPSGLFDGFAPAAGAEPVPAMPHASTPAPAAGELEGSAQMTARGLDAAPLLELDQTGVAPEAPPPGYVEQAIAVFNASEFPRRVAGVARSLGAPAVNVRSAEHLDSVVSIVVAWELCWYRYEVDLSEPGAEAQAIGQGTELAQLACEDRHANAAASESGALALAGV
jgi:hypothetical protein